MPKVTVIIPNYNHARFLERRIQSILDQTYQDFEILYLDDASTDDSNRVFALFADNPRIRTILNEQNSGNVFKQWNRGVHEARGECIWIAESDDCADSRLLATLVDRLDRFPEVGVAYCESWAVDADDNRLELYRGYMEQMHPDRWHQDFVNSGKDECARYMVAINTIPNASAVVFRRSIYERAGYADETIHLSGDWRMWAKMLLISDVAFVCEPLNFYRQHPNAVRYTTKTALRMEEWYRVSEYISRKVEIEPDVCEAVYERIMHDWLLRALQGPERLTWKENVRIFRAAGPFDPRLKRRLAKRVGMHFMERSGLLSPALAVKRGIKRLMPKSLSP